MNGYQLRRISGPSAQALLTLAQAKAQCRIDDDITEDDTWLEDAIEEAREHIEGYLQSTIAPSVWEFQTDAFPSVCPYEIHLPMGPLIAVEDFSYLNRDGTRTTLAGADAFQTVPFGTAGRVIPAYGSGWPAAFRSTTGSLVIRYRAGYVSGSPEAVDAPRPIARAMKLLVAHWYANREAIVSGTITKEMELGFYDVLQPFRNYT